MNEMINKLLLAGDKLVPEMHSRKPGFTYSPCRPFTRNKERIEKSKETGDSRTLYQNQLDNACFQDDKVYGDFKDLNKGTKLNKVVDKVLRDKAFNIAKNPQYDGY